MRAKLLLRPCALILAGLGPVGSVSVHADVIPWEQSKLTAGAAAADGDGFGWKVAASGDTVVVGVPLDDHAGNEDAGSAYVFVRVGATWSQQAWLTPTVPQPLSYFGYSVAVDADTILVGAHFEDALSRIDAGSVYVFVRSGTSWSQQAKLNYAGAENGDLFGWSVAVDGDTALVGAINEDDAGDFYFGAVHAFTRSGTSWSPQDRLVPNDPFGNASFGSSVAVEGDTAWIGASNEWGSGAQGAAYVFTRTSGSWSQAQKLVPGDTDPDNDYFGYSVSLAGSRAVVGAPNYNGSVDRSGSAYVFQRSGAVWSERQKLKPSDTTSAEWDWFGASVCVSGSKVLVGAPAANPNAGTAYLFEDVLFNWVETSRLRASDGTAGARFGDGVAHDGDTMVIGSSVEQVAGAGSAGSAYGYQLVPGPQPFCLSIELLSCPCAAGDFESGCDIAQGTGGVRLDLETQRFSPQNRATVLGSGFPPASAPAVVTIRGTGTDSAGPVVFGDGLRCVGLPVVRLAATFAAGGVSRHTFGHGAMAGPGVFYYQLWFRNTPAMYCTPDAFNLSSGMRLTWPSH